MARYSISVLSFVYTVTVLLVIVFGIEIMQKITNRGRNISQRIIKKYKTNDPFEDLKRTLVASAVS